MRTRLFFTFISFIIFNQTFLQSQNWTHFRGNNLDGIYTGNIPKIWNDSFNVVWKTPIHDIGWSSPVVFDQQVWLTTATDDGKKMYATCLDLNSGKINFDILVFEPDSVEESMPLTHTPLLPHASKMDMCMFILVLTVQLV
ncbi:MAG: hypothetical protein HC906_03925 [Bacteroidales bacterium]|nr:hypothetical protein [Bacteroidales bacterium]